MKSMVAFLQEIVIIFLKKSLHFETLIVRGQQHSFSTHERMFL